MLIANEVIACHLWNLHVPCLYRVHEAPDPAKLESLMPILAYLGLKFPTRNEVTTAVLQTALDSSARLEHGFIARRMLLRSMMQARYTPENLGHFGLASRCYCHFTSPIRRYPDLMVHRVTKACIAAGMPAQGTYHPPGALPPEHGFVAQTQHAAAPVQPTRWMQILEQTLPDTGKTCSERERRAEQIEREATQLKIVEYMQRHIGDEFDGLVTTVLAHGFFVQLKQIPVEGFVPARTINDDYYEFEDDKMLLRGRATGRIIKLADKATVSVVSANTTRQEIDLALIAINPSGLETPDERKKKSAPTKQSAKYASRHTTPPRRAYKTPTRHRR